MNKPPRKKYKQFLATMTSASVVASTVFVAVPSDTALAQTQFSDISEARESYQAIHELVSLGVITGYPDGTFRPRVEITRQQAAVMFTRAFNLDTRNVKDPGFQDIALSHQYYNEIAAAVEAGFFNRGGQFNPGGSFTRAQAATVIARAFNLTGNAPYPFSDNAGSHTSNVSLMANLGLINGYSDGTFRPNQPLYREHFAMLMHRTIEEVGLPEPSKQASIFSIELDQNANHSLYLSGQTEGLREVVIRVYRQDHRAGQPLVEEVVSVDRAGRFELVTDPLELGTYVIVVDGEGVQAEERTYELSNELLGRPGEVTNHNQPSSRSLGLGTPLNEVFRFQVTAGEEEIQLRSTQLRQLGTAHARDHIEEVYLLDENGMVITVGTVNQDNVVRLSRSVRIPEHTTKEFTVAVSLEAHSSAITATVQFAIESVDAFTANTKLNGSFPIVGNSFSIVHSNVGTLEVRGSNRRVDVEVGDTQEELGEFTLQPSGEGVRLEKVIIYGGNFDVDSFANLYLYRSNGGTRIPVQGFADREKVVFDLKEEEIEIDRSRAETFALRGDPTDAQSFSRFEIEEAYDIVAKGKNSGHNVRASLRTNENERSVFLSNSFDVTSGNSRLTISSSTPRQGQSVVATSSAPGVVREYDLVAPGEDMTITNMKVDLNVKGGYDISDLITAVEIYNPKNNMIIGSETISNVSGDTFTLDFDRVNWYVERGAKETIQLRVRSTRNETFADAEIDARLSFVEFDLEETRERNRTMLDSALPSSPQYKRLIAGGLWKVDRVPASERIYAYSISDTLRQAPLGAFRLEAEHEEMRVDEIVVSAADINNSLLSAEGMNGRLDNLLAAPNLYEVGSNTPVAAGTFSRDGSEIEFDFDRNYTIKPGLQNRKSYYIRADILSTGMSSATDLSKTLNLHVSDIDARGNDSNVRLSLDRPFTDTVEPTGTGGNRLAGLNYRDTSAFVSLQHSSNRTAPNTSNQRIFTFTIENMSTIGLRGHDLFVEQIPVYNQFDWGSDVRDFDLAEFTVRDDRNQRYQPVTLDVSNNRVVEHGDRHFRGYAPNSLSSPFVFTSLGSQNVRSSSVRSLAESAEIEKIVEPSVTVLTEVDGQHVTISGEVSGEIEKVRIQVSEANINREVDVIDGKYSAYFDGLSEGSYEVRVSALDVVEIDGEGQFDIGEPLVKDLQVSKDGQNLTVNGRTEGLNRVMAQIEFDPNLDDTIREAFHDVWKKEVDVRRDRFSVDFTDLPPGDHEVSVTGIDFSSGDQYGEREVSTFTIAQPTISHLNTEVQDGTVTVSGEASDVNRVRVKVEEDDVESSEVAASSTGYSEVVNVSNGNFTATFNDLAEGSFVATVIPLAGPVGHEVDLVSFGSSNWSNSFDVPDQSSEPEEPTDGGSVNDGEDENEEGSNPITIDDAFVDWSITAITGGVVMEAELDAEAIDVVKEIQINFDLEGGSQEEVTLTKPLEESDGNAYRRAIDLPAGIHEYTISALNGSGDVVGEVKAGSVTVSVLPRWQQQPGYLYVQSGSSGRTETELFTVVGNFSYSRLPVDSLGRTQSGDRVNVFDGSMIRFDLDRHRMSDFRIVSRQSLLETNGNPASHHYITPFVENYQGAEITVPIR